MYMISSTYIIIEFPHNLAWLNNTIMNSKRLMRKHVATKEILVYLIYSIAVRSTIS